MSCFIVMCNAPLTFTIIANKCANFSIPWDKVFKSLDPEFCFVRQKEGKLVALTGK